MNSQLEFGSLFEVQAIEVQNPVGHYYNTTGLTGRILKDRQLRADSKARKILDFFKAHPGQSFTPYEILRQLNLSPFQITSVSRAITDLTTDGKLRMTGEKVVECQGEWNNKWMIIL